MAIGWLIFGGLVAVYIGYWLYKGAQQDRVKTEEMVASVLANMKANLGVDPDAKSIVWLAQHSGFTAVLHDVFEKGDFELIQEKTAHKLKSHLQSIMPYDRFIVEYPAAAALYDYAYWYADITLSRGRTSVPKRLLDAPVFKK